MEKNSYSQGQESEFYSCKMNTRHSHDDGQVVADCDGRMDTPQS